MSKARIEGLLAAFPKLKVSWYLVGIVKHITYEVAYILPKKNGITCRIVTPWNLSCRMITPIFFSIFLNSWKTIQTRKNNEAGNSLNAVDCKPVPTRVLNPTASEASYKLKQRSYGKTKLKKIGVIILQERFHGVTILQVVVLGWQFYRWFKLCNYIRKVFLYL